METASKSPVVKEVMLQAPVQQVWNAITNRDELAQWCFDMDAFQPEIGFRFTFYGEKDGTKFLHLCTVTELIPMQKMVWLWSYHGVPGDTFVTFELFPGGQGTRLVLTHEGLEKLPQDENYAKENFVAGWNEIIGRLLKEYVERK